MEEYRMPKTRDLILDKARESDWEDMYRNVWSRPECAEYMAWRVTETEEEAKARIRRTIEFQKTHETWLVYETASGTAIGFAGMERLSGKVCMEAEICLGPEYQKKGYGRQILACLIRYCKDRYGAEEFLYSVWEKNLASRRLAESFGFTLRESEEKTDERNGNRYILLRYEMRI